MAGMICRNPYPCKGARSQDIMEVVAVAAVAENGVIGADGEIPWPSVPADRKQYRERVAAFPVILGRRTFESMRDDLPGSHQIVLSRSVEDYEIDGVDVVDSPEAAAALARRLPADTVYVLGGGAIYAVMFPHMDRLLISRIPGTYEGDTWFPEIDESDWQLVRTESQPGFTLEEWERIGD